jgi:apolipoprotein N-acyltransferase
MVFIKAIKEASCACRARPWLVVLTMLSGMVQALAWPPYNLQWLAWISFVPFFVVLTRAPGWRWPLSLAFLQGFTATCFGFFWLSYMAHSFGGIPKPLAPAVVALYALVGQGQIFVVVGLFLWVTHQRVAIPSLFRPLVLAMVYVGIECVYPKIFEDTQGAILYRYLNLIQITEHTGVFGLTALVLWVNAVATAVAVLFIARLSDRRRDNNRSSHSNHTRYSHSKGTYLAYLFQLSPRGVAIHLATLATVFLVVLKWGRYRVAQVDAIYGQATRSLNVAAIQPNIGDAEKLASERGVRMALATVLNTYQSMSELAVKELKPDLVLWPETSFPYLYTHFKNERANARGEAKDIWIADLVQSLNTPLLFGGYHNDGTYEYNALWLVSGAQEPAGLYLKNKLLAFGEYVPLGPLAPFVRSLFPAMGNFGRGPGPSVLPFRDIQFGPLICYETLSPSFVRKTVEKGAQVLINLTNDSWFGPVGEPESHLLLSLYRSIEQRLPLLRVTNTGITAHIDAAGRIVKQSPVFQPVIFEARIPILPPGAISRGVAGRAPVFEIICFMVTCFLLGLASKKWVRKAH